MMTTEDADWLRSKAEFAPDEETEARYKAIAGRIERHRQNFEEYRSISDEMLAERDAKILALESRLDKAEKGWTLCDQGWEGEVRELEAEIKTLESRLQACIEALQVMAGDPTINDSLPADTLRSIGVVERQES